MKRFRLLLIGLVLAGAMSADAQVRFGAKGGISFSTFVGENQISIPVAGNDINLDLSQVRDGFAGGGFVTIQLVRWFALQPELLYVQKGGKTSVFGADITWKADYFEVPLLARFNVPLGQSSFYIFGGPSMAFKTNSKIEADILGQHLSQNIGITRSNEWSATAGAGFEVPAGPVFLSFDARYTIGLQKILDLNDRLNSPLGPVDIPDFWDGRNGTLLLLLGVGFQVAGK